MRVRDAAITQVGEWPISDRRPHGFRSFVVSRPLDGIQSTKNWVMGLSSGVHTVERAVDFGCSRHSDGMFRALHDLPLGTTLVAAMYQPGNVNLSVVRTYGTINQEIGEISAPPFYLSVYDEMGNRIRTRAQDSNPANPKYSIVPVSVIDRTVEVTLQMHSTDLPASVTSKGGVGKIETHSITLPDCAKYMVVVFGANCYSDPVLRANGMEAGVEPTLSRLVADTAEAVAPKVFPNASNFPFVMGAFEFTPEPTY